MKRWGLAVVWVYSAVACGGRTALETATSSRDVPPPGRTVTPPNQTPPPGDTSAYGGGYLGVCSGDEYAVVDDCSLCPGAVAYALCDGFLYDQCSCFLPSGWTEMTGPGVADAGSDGTVSIEDASFEDAFYVSEETPEPLLADPNGYVSPDNNRAGVVGAWYVYGDGWGTLDFDGGAGVAGERGTCELIGGFPVSDCSTITSPLPPAPVSAGPDAAAPLGYANGFPPTSTVGSQAFCFSGTGATVITRDGGTSPDYADIYGIGMGLDFNNVDGVKSPYDAPAHYVIGVQFTVTSSGVFPPLRVEFPTTETNNVGGSNDPYDFSPEGPGQYSVYWEDLANPYPPVVGMNVSYLPPAGSTQPIFNPAHLLSIQFHVPTNTAGSVAVTNLCVSNLSMLYEAARP